MKRLLVTFLLLFIVKSTAACTCIGMEKLRDAFMYSEVIILGKIISKDTISFKSSSSGLTIRQNIYQVKVHSYYKGKSNDQIITMISGFGNGDCGYVFEVDKTYIIYSNRNEHPSFNHQNINDFLSTDLCKRTKIYDKKEIKKLERLGRKL